MKRCCYDFSGHRDYVIDAFFRDQETIYTVSKDGALFTWEYTERPSEESDDEDEDEDEENQ